MGSQLLYAALTPDRRRNTIMQVQPNARPVVLKANIASKTVKNNNGGGTKELLRNIDLEIREGTLVALLGSAGAGKTSVYRTGGLELDDDARVVTVDGEEVSLTPIEYGILRFLMAGAGRVYSIEEIYENVWKEEAYGAENTVAVHVRRIREKIEIDPKNPRYLKVVWGVGYKIEKY
jgi:DNA-binding response OmpR family regulator